MIYQHVFMRLRLQAKQLLSMKFFKGWPFYFSTRIFLKWIHPIYTHNRANVSNFKEMQKITLRFRLISLASKKMEKFRRKNFPNRCSNWLDCCSWPDMTNRLCSRREPRKAREKQSLLRSRMFARHNTYGRAREPCC